MTRTIDQNDDGPIELKYVAMIADNVGSAARKIASSVQGNVIQNTNQIGESGQIGERA